MSNLIPRILGWLIVIITLALAPTINTSNAAVATALTASTGNATDMIGMWVVQPFGAPLMILGLLFAGGMFGLGKIGDGTVRGMLDVIGAVILTIVALAMFEEVIGYVDTLLVASTGFADVIYGVIPIILYVGVIAGAGLITAAKAFKGKRKAKSTGY